MRPNQFSADTIIALLRKQTVASLPEVMAALGPRVSRRTAFRKLKDLHARTSYSHRGGYYTLDELADFDERGLWAFAGVRFSRAGTLVATAEAFVNHAEAGHFVDELDNLLHVGTQDALRKLAGDGRLTRHKLAGQFLYCAPDDAQQTHQPRARRLLMATPGGPCLALVGNGASWGGSLPLLKRTDPERTADANRATVSPAGGNKGLSLFFEHSLLKRIRHQRHNVSNKGHMLRPIHSGQLR